jgi:uncharacterized Zn finger protein
MKCPKCGSIDLKGVQGRAQNMFCANCGYFPIPFPKTDFEKFKDVVKVIVKAPKSKKRKPKAQPKKKPKKKGGK